MNDPHTPEPHHLELRPLTQDDYPEIRRIMEAAEVYGRMGGAWTQQQFSRLLNTFAEGQICIEDRGRVVAAALSLIVDYEAYGDDHTYDEITDYGRFTTHDPGGDVLYGIDVFVDPEFRGLRLGRRLYDARKDLCRRLGLRAIVAGGRIPGYAKHADQMTPDQYIEQVKRKELRDPILSFQLANDFHVRRILTHYEPMDKASRAYATLVQWDNIFYRQQQAPLGTAQPVVRVGTVQWRMRPVASLDELIAQVEFFVDALAGYNADFTVFPEFFNAPLMGLYPDLDAPAAVRQLAEFTEPTVARMQELALAYNTNIIAGSMPIYEDDRLYNVSYLLRRDGSQASYRKLHITPDERETWGMTGGDTLEVFDTDAGKIGILVCYDVEFPELGRLLAEQGLQILFALPNRYQKRLPARTPVRSGARDRKRMLRRDYRRRRQLAAGRKHRHSIFADGGVFALRFCFSARCRGGGKHPKHRDDIDRRPRHEQAQTTARTRLGAKFQRPSPRFVRGSLVAPKTQR